MATTNKELGKNVQRQLQHLNLETPISESLIHYTPDTARNRIRIAFGQIMDGLNLNMEDDSLKDTPERLAKMYVDEIFYGLNYANFPKCTTVANKMNYDEMVSINHIEVKSLCEHHFVPFVGEAHVAYIPKEKVMGLSKFNRVVDFFARRPQIQERLTEQIYAALSYILDTQDVAIVIKAEHMCVKLRGAKDQHSETVTSKMGGKFFSEKALRAEFLALTNGGKK